MHKRYPLTLICVAVIWYLSFFTPPPVELPEMKLGWDKLVHTAMYGGLCFLFWMEHYKQLRLKRADHVQWRNLFWIALVAPVLMGGLIEVLQENCTNHRRSGDWYDFAANTLGVLIMYGLARMMQNKLLKK